MCGIGGILRTDGQPIPEEWLDAIDARIAYRGPDGHGRFRDRVEIADANAPGGKRVVEVAFMHRRLSIIDHKDGAQPMVSERGRNDSEGLVAVVFNGCIYNHRELRKELEAKGHTFVTDHSDTEVLIHGWREWEGRLAERLQGMFAFILWDRMNATLAYGRDVFGEKPLFKATYPWDISDSSLPSAITVVCSDPIGCAMIVGWTLEMPKPSSFRSWVGEYCQTGYPLTHALPFVENYRTASVNHGESVQLNAWGDRTFEGTDGLFAWLPPEPSDLAIEQLIRTAVVDRLEADFPLGCFLSGGVDSSLVARFAKDHLGKLQTFCVRMPDSRFDESRFAAIAADAIGSQHETLDVSTSPADDLVELIGRMGQPFGDSSILPTYWVCRAARQHVKVALAGDGGDELFIGYERHLAAPHVAKWWRALSLIPEMTGWRSPPKSARAKLARLGLMGREFKAYGFLALVTPFSERQVIALVGDEPGSNCFTSTWRPSIIPQFEPRDDMRRYDIHYNLCHDLLRKVDVASMASGIEVRCPFLDKRLASTALAAPIEQLMPGGQRKGLLRQIARKYLPMEIVDRPKMGFAIPIGEWFRSDYGGMKTLLLDHLNSVEPFGPIQLNCKAVQRFIDEHMSGKRDHGQRLFTLLTLSIWARQAAR